MTPRLQPGDIINYNGNAREVISDDGKTLELMTPEKPLPPEVLRRLGLLSEVAEEVGV